MAWPLLVVAAWTLLHTQFAHRLADPCLRQPAAIVGTGLASLLAAWLAARKLPGATLTTAITQAAEAVLITDREGKTQYVNPAFTAMTGYTAAEVIGQNPCVVKSGKHAAGFYKELWETIRAGNIWHGSLVNLRKDGTEYTEELSLKVVQTFVEGLPAQLDALRRHLTDGDVSNARRQAHTIKGAAANVSAEGLRGLALQAERAAAAAELVPAMEEEFVKFKAAVER